MSEVICVENDVLAAHKMNTFHWHLTDDQGWRIEIKKYPKLTEIGSQRSETMVDYFYTHYPFKYDGKPHGGFYTQDEIKEVVAYAQSKYITVIPEIELPGHALALSLPTLNCPALRTAPTKFANYGVCLTKYSALPTPSSSLWKESWTKWWNYSQALIYI